MRALMAGLILGAVMVVAVAWDALRAVRSPLEPPTTPTVLTLAPGTGWHALVAQLERDGWLSHPRDALYLRAYGRMLPESRAMKAGEYRIREPLSPRALLDLLISGDVIEYALTLIEGWRLRDALAAIRGHEAVAQSLPQDDAAAMARIAEVLDIGPEGDSLRYRFAVPAAIGRYLAPKGSVALDGVSLTVNELEQDGERVVFGCNVIPHTAEVTTFGSYRPGQRVNFEIDLIARYVARLLPTQLQAGA